MTKTAEERFRVLVESMLGVDYVGPLDEMAQALGVDLEDPTSWATLERRWEALRPEVDLLRSNDGRAFVQVEPVFQAVIEQDENVFDPSILATYPPGIRMLIATRVIEGQVDNGGWPAVFFNGVDPHLEGAIEGYQLLGLADHAALAGRVRGHGWTEPDDDTPDDPAWDRFYADWLGLPDAEEARARYLRDHGADFPT